MTQPRLSTLLEDGVVGEGFEILAPRLPEHPGSEYLDAWSLARIRSAVNSMAWRLGRPTAHGTPVTALVLPEGIRVPIAALAAIRAGRVPLLINPRLDESAIGHLLTRSEAREVITAAQEIPTEARSAIEACGLKAIDASLAGSHDSTRFEPLTRPPDAPAAIFHTSGTTGMPKMVMWSDEQAVSGAWHYVDGELAPSLKSFLLAMPSTHTAGLAFFAMCALAGIRGVVLPLPDPKTLTSVSNAVRPDAVGAFSATLTELVAAGLQDDLADSVKLWVNMGDTAHAKHIRALVDSPKRPRGFAVGDGLGSSEMGWGAFRHRIHRDDRPKSRCIGTPAPGTRALILSPEGEPLPDERAGLLAVSSPHVAPGYWNDHARYWADRRGEYFVTGDVALRAADGSYFQLDRHSDVIDPDSGDYSLLVEEAIIDSHEAVLDASVFTDRVSGAVTAAVRFFDHVPEAERESTLDSLRASGPSVVTTFQEWTDRHVRRGVTGKVRKAYSAAETKVSASGRPLPAHLRRLRPPSDGDLEASLERQVRRARRSEFYRDRLDPSASFAATPPTTKEDLRSGYPFSFLAIPNSKVATYHESSGTTGIPSVSFYTEAEWVELARRFDRKPSEIVADDAFLIRIPHAFVLAGMLADACARQKGATVIAGSSRSLAAPPSRAARVIRDLGVTKTWSTPTEILLVASAMMAQGADPSRDAPGLRDVFVGGEILTPAKRRFISRTWGGVEVAQEFGCTEAGSLAGSWPDGTVRWWSDVALAEVLCDDGAIRRNGTGRLLVTPLLREAMPLLRYETGDRVTIEGNGGDEFPTMSFHGRGSSLPGGLTAGLVEDAFYSSLEAGELLFWRAAIAEAKATVEVEPSPGVSVSSTRLADIAEAMSQTLSIPIELNEVARGTLVEPSILVAKNDAMKPSRVFAAGEPWDGARIRA